MSYLYNLFFNLFLPFLWLCILLGRLLKILTPESETPFWKQDEVTARKYKLYLFLVSKPCTCALVRKINIAIFKLQLKRRFDMQLALCLTFWRRNYFFLILAHPVYKMWITQEPNKLELWNKLHFKEKKTESIHHV